MRPGSAARQMQQATLDEEVGKFLDAEELL